MSCYVLHGLCTVRVHGRDQVPCQLENMGVRLSRDNSHRSPRSVVTVWRTEQRHIYRITAVLTILHNGSQRGWRQLYVYHRNLTVPGGVQTKLLEQATMTKFLTFFFKRNAFSDWELYTLQAFESTVLYAPKFGCTSDQWVSFPPSSFV